MKKCVGRARLFKEMYRNDGTMYDSILLAEAVNFSWLTAAVGHSIADFKKVEDTESKKVYVLEVDRNELYRMEIDK